MAEYDIQYSETYSRTYHVNAASYEEAKEKLHELILDGALDGPDCCVDSEYKDVTKHALQDGSAAKMGRVVKVKADIAHEAKKYFRQDKFGYKGFRIYQEATPSGYLVSQSWLIVKEKEDSPLILQIESFNDMSLYEVVDAIDQYETTGKFGFLAWLKMVSLNGAKTAVYLIHHAADIAI